MTTSYSNATQRRNALLRATALVLAVMLLTGFTVSLFPTAKEVDYMGNHISLQKIKQEHNWLIRKLLELERYTDTIAIYDNQWESAATSGKGAFMKQQIKPFENKMADLKNELEQKSANDLAVHAGKAYNTVLIVRDMLWALRDKYRDPVQPNDPCADLKQQLLLIRQEARSLADGLENEARFLEDQIKIKGIFWEKGEARKKLETVIKRLRVLESRLRQI